MVQLVSLAQFVFSSCMPMLMKFLRSLKFISLALEEQEEVERATIDNAQLITKCCWRELLIFIGKYY